MKEKIRLEVGKLNWWEVKKKREREREREKKRTNKGKGRTIRTMGNHIFRMFPSLILPVTNDGDGGFQV